MEEKREKRSFTKTRTTAEKRPVKSTSRGRNSADDRPKRTFGSSDDKPRRSFSDDKPKRSFSDDKPRRSFSDDKPKRSYSSDKPRTTSSDDRPRRSFSDDKPKRSYSSDKPRTTSSDERPRRSFSDDKPKRSYSSDRPRPASGEDKPRRSFSDDRPKRSYSSDRPRPASGEDKPRRSFSDDRPKRSYSSDRPRPASGEDKPRRSFSDDRPKRSYSSDRPRPASGEDKPRRSFSDDKPKRSFSSDRPRPTSGEDKPRRSFSDDRPKRSFSDDRPKRAFNSDRPKRSYDGDNAAPRRKRRDVTAESSILSEIVEKRILEGRQSPKKQKILSLEYEELHGPIRLNKYISNAGVCSRREADTLIQEGLVTVNGEVITELGSKVLPTDEVRFGDKVLQREKPVYILLNKPKDFITTMDDEKDRKHVIQLIKGACKERVYPVGRLDKNTTGLLLFTNDGDLTKKLTHPKHEVRKVYYVELDKNLALKDFESIANGIELEDGEIKVDEIAYVGDSKKEVGVTIHSGRNRIVRRIFESFGYDIVKLDRVVFAGLTKKDLPRGDWRMLTQAEINILKMSVK